MEFFITEAERKWRCHYWQARFGGLQAGARSAGGVCFSVGRWGLQAKGSAMARETRPPRGFDAAQRCRQVEMAFVTHVLRVLDDLLAQAERERHPIRHEVLRTRTVLRARYQRLRVEDEAPEAPADEA